MGANLSVYEDKMKKTLSIIFALAMIVSQLIFSDVPFLRMFINPFKQIGTESLLQ